MNIDKVERIQKLPNKKRVCAYARVSAEKEMSLHSLSYQISYYSQLIQSHRDWTYVGVYSDEGISGTKVDRPGFQRMMEDARDGKIDLILTKSVSRFARNTVVLLEACRELKNLGVDVYFEEQKINSMSYEGELMLTLQASFAQEETRSTSLNQRWRIKKDFEEGRLWGGANCVGYKIVNRKFVIDEATSPIVRRVYSLYLDGLGDHAIAKLLNEEGVPSLKGGRWAQSHIKSMLTNVTYKGDLLL
jgi:DNA invertase Pin-like site-specific DNA recombinase